MQERLYRFLHFLQSDLIEDLYLYLDRTDIYMIELETRSPLHLYNMCQFVGKTHYSDLLLL